MSFINVSYHTCFIYSCFYINIAKAQNKAYKTNYISQENPSLVRRLYDFLVQHGFILILKFINIFFLIA